MNIHNLLNHKFLMVRVCHSELIFCSHALISRVIDVLMRSDIECFVLININDDKSHRIVNHISLRDVSPVVAGAIPGGVSCTF